MTQAGSLGGRSRVSIVTAVLNNERSLERCIDSVLSQTHKDVEFIIIDGGSSDRTLEIIKKYDSYIAFWSSEPDKGIYDAMNKGIMRSTGFCVNTLNSDDWLERSACKNVAEIFHDSKCDIVCGSASVHRPDGSFHSLWEPTCMHPGSILGDIPFNHQAMFAGRWVYDSIGLYDITRRIAADRKWMQMAHNSGFIYSMTEKVLSHYTLGGMSGDMQRSIDDIARVITDVFPSVSIEDAAVLYKRIDQGIWLTFRSEAPSFEEFAQILRKSESDTLFLNAMAHALAMEVVKLKFHIESLERCDIVSANYSDSLDSLIRRTVKIWKKFLARKIKKGFK
jgi:glycosyltransferase involved in cell wall biosynthesis